jgi:hypothetical protein
MRKKSDIDREIADLEGTLARLGEDLDSQRSAVTAAESERKQLALSAEGFHDSVAEKALIAAGERQDKAQRRAENLIHAIAAGREKMAELRRSRDEALQSEAWSEFQRVAERGAEEARILDASLSTLAKLFAEHGQTLKAMGALSAQAGKPRIFSLKHARRFLESRLHSVDPHEFGSQPAEYRNDYETFMRKMIDSTDGAAESTEDDENKRAS